MHIYVSGPMTGKPDLNFPLFRRVTEALRAQGHTVVNPVEINGDTNADWLDCIRADLAAMRGCNAICLLPEWHDSTGARIEVLVGQRYGMDLIAAEGLVPEVFGGVPA